MRRSTRSAFTLVELMIIVAILADVMIIAFPAFIRARNTAQNSRFISDLRTAVGGFEMFAAENNRYPAEAAASALPSGMAPYLAGVAWVSKNSIGTAWDWEPGYQGATAAIRLTASSNLDDLRMQDIDVRLDNGALSTGMFRKVDDQNYVFIVEP